ncbi:hypothetical protein [Saccharopolyspora taberi]|uniref:Uncharacterized protein n=1 Tax=Saccharopolyspora taberi TaxID=60895 RepID=A0ABN3V0Q7_9PSEU
MTMPNLADVPHEQIAYRITVARTAQLALRATEELGHAIDALLDELARRLQ